jgi:uncharacterized protein YhaN
MKLKTLNLKAVGPFTNVVLDLSAGQHGLHLIYGPNEAGKSSALRALSHLLFGFPHLSADNFVHPNEQLRIGATLKRSSGEELTIIRRRGQKNTLRGADDLSAVAEEQLTRFLSGMNQETFGALFGIDHDRLTQAGEEIRTGKGHLGELLFAAGAGLAGLSQAQSMLSQELEKLFKPRGQNPRINKTLAEFRGLQDEVKQRQLPSEEWQKHDRAYHETSGAAEQIREQMRKARSEQARQKRMKAAIPLVAGRRRLNSELAELGDVIRLRDEFGTELRTAQQQLHMAEYALSKARAALEEIDRRLAQLDPPQKLLEVADEIEKLQNRLGAAEKASDDRIRLESYQQDCEHQARRILRDLARPINLDEAETLRLRIDEPVAIRRLGQRFAELRSQIVQATKTIARHDDQIKRLEEERAELEELHDVEALRRGLQQARKAGDINARVTEARNKLKHAQKKGATALAQLAGWDRSATELEHVAIPLSASLDEFESQLQEATSQRHLVADRIAAEDESIRQLETRLQSLELEQDVPTEELLLAARQRRDEGWSLVRRAWLASEPDGEDVAAFLAEFAASGTLSLAYEQSVARSDSVADRLRREADRVAHKAETLAQLQRHRGTRTALEYDREVLEALQAELKQQWNGLIGPLAINAVLKTPAELRAWLSQRAEVVRLHEQAEEARQSFEPLAQTLTSTRTAICRALNDFGEVLSASGSDLGEVLELAESVINRHDDLSKKRAKLETALATARTEETTAELALNSAKTELASWRNEWATMMERIGLEAEATPEQAEVFLSKITELFEKLNEGRNHQSRIRGIDRDADEFTRDVRALIVRVAADIADGPADEQARELARRLRDAQANAQQCAALIAQREREAANAHVAEKEREEARACLEQLCKEARRPEFGDLAEAERRSQARARLEAERTTCEDQLLAAAAGVDLSVFVNEVEQVDAGSLDAMIEELEGRIAAQDQELRRLDQTIGAERGELARMDGSDRAAEAAEEAQTLLAQLQRDVARYATLKLAAVAMQRAIERYREKNQGPILARAGALFANLTGGSFARLQIDDDGDGRSVLKAVRPDGRLVGVEGMSDGSHDQLYLALRLASLESWLAAHEPVPFVVDDILLNFDDARATAALVALAGLSRRTQVLFFTHHRHLVELAHEHLPREVVFVHELVGPVTHTRNIPTERETA